MWTTRALGLPTRSAPDILQLAAAVEQLKLKSKTGDEARPLREIMRFYGDAVAVGASLGDAGANVVDTGANVVDTGAGVGSLGDAGADVGS